MNINKILANNLIEHKFSIKNKNIILLLTKYIYLIKKWNNRINLTSDFHFTKIIKRHIIDSLYVMKLNFVSQCETILDIGSGAGFPGIILNIYTGKATTLIESNTKKAYFLSLVKQKLHLDKLNILCERAEKLSKLYIYREKFDCVISRALANFLTTMELSFPFSKINGNIIYFSTEKYNKTIYENFNKIKILGCDRYNLFPYKIDNIQYYIFYVKKLWKTPIQYPGSFKKR